jgi:hypothetical protein
MKKKKKKKKEKGFSSKYNDKRNPGYKCGGPKLFLIKEEFEE